MSGPVPSPFLAVTRSSLEASEHATASRPEPEYLASPSDELPELIAPDGGELELFALEGEQEGMESHEGLSVASTELGEVPSPFVATEESFEASFAQSLGLEEPEHEQSRSEQADRIAEAAEEAPLVFEGEEEGAHPLLALFPLPAAVLDALSRGLWSVALEGAMVAGFRDVTQLTNIVFYFRHPEVIGRKIRSDERALAAEWISVRDQIVRPALQRAAPAPAHSSQPSAAPSVSGGPPIPSSRLRWKDATEDKLAFMRAVYEQHFANSKAGPRPYVADLPDSTLDTIYGRHRARKDAAAAARRLLDAARSALAAEGLAGRIQVGIVSAYRPAEHQFEIWQGFGRRGGFPHYYGKAIEQGVLRAGDYGPDAVRKMARYIGQYIAAPGFSNHQDGLAIDFGTGRVGGDIAVIGTDSWFHHWLVGNGEGFGFHPYVKEAWHWVYQAPGAHELGEMQTEQATSTGIRAGRLEVPHVAMLARHRGRPPDMVLRWNEMSPAPPSVDVVVHLHGYSRTGMTLPRDIEQWSGLDLQPVDGAAARGRSQPTLTVLPRGDDTGQRTRRGLYRYTFPALTGRGGLARIVQIALDRFASEVHIPVPSLGRLILTAHSGGGEALLRILEFSDPHEVHIFDALYQDAAPLAAWAVKRIETDATALDALAGSGTEDGLTHGGALRVFYRPPTAGHSRDLLRTISRHLRPQLTRRYRVEPSTLGHWQIPRQYGWRILADVTADVPRIAGASELHHELDESGEAALEESPLAAEEYDESGEQQAADESEQEEAALVDEAHRFDPPQPTTFETPAEAFTAEVSGEQTEMSLSAEELAYEEGESFFGPATELIRDVIDAMKTRARIAGGVRNEVVLTNQIFFERHPARGGRDLTPGEPDFAALQAEWQSIRDRIVRPALRPATAPTTAAKYDRDGAVAYARKFFLRPCDDQFIALGASAGKNFVKVPAGTKFVHEFEPDGTNKRREHALLPDGTQIPWEHLDDCTHFISCCIGERPGERSGGLKITIKQLGEPPTAPFGIVRVSTMVDFLVRSKLAKIIGEKSEDDTLITKLQPGDLVAYFNKSRKVYSHMALLLPGNKIACHTYGRSDQPACTWDNDWDLGRGTHQWTFLHIVA
jgi:D-alanyl-D-alanine carboxypeptidase